MGKGLTFGNCDLNLIKEIEKYQQEKGLPTFISAVRELCNIAIQKTKK